jgi:hypothetical protein
VPGYDRVVPPGRGPAGGLSSFKCPNSTVTRPALPRQGGTLRLPAYPFLSRRQPEKFVWPDFHQDNPQIILFLNLV